MKSLLLNLALQLLLCTCLFAQADVNNLSSLILGKDSLFWQAYNTCDVEKFKEFVAEAFTQSGVDGVHYVHTAMEAFMYLQSIEDSKELPRLIVTDYFLPGITGPEFLADLKGMPKYKHIHVIVLSGSKSPSEIEHLKSLGATDYLVKPRNYDEYVKVAADIAARVA